MMTKTILSDGRHTRPRFAAPTPTPPKFLIATDDPARIGILSDQRESKGFGWDPAKTLRMAEPPKFLIGTFQQSKNHSTPSKQTTNPNPNSNKTRVSRPPLRIADSPWRFAASAISRPRPLFGLTPFAQPHPRKGLVSGAPQKNGGASYASLHLAQLHPRNKQSARARSAVKSKTPAGRRRYKVPFAQPDPCNAVTPLPALFLYRWPPAGIFEVLPTSRPLSGLTPLAQIHPRNLDSRQRTRLPRPAPPRGIDALGISRPLFGLAPLAPFHPRNLPPFYGIPFTSGTALSPRPLALRHPRNAVTALSAVFLYRWPPAGVFQVLPTSRPLFGLAPLAQPHPRNEQSARARSAETSKTPARCRRHKNQPLALTFALEAPLATAFLIVTPRLEIVATAREINEMQNSNRYKMSVLQP
jgi:hypothetical protein